MRGGTPAASASAWNWASNVDSCVRHERQRSALPAGDSLAVERARRPRFAVGGSEAVRTGSPFHGGSRAIAGAARIRASSTTTSDGTRGGPVESLGFSSGTSLHCHMSELILAGPRRRINSEGRDHRPRQRAVPRWQGREGFRDEVRGVSGDARRCGVVWGPVRPSTIQGELLQDCRGRQMCKRG